ncbi:MAG: DUF1624 domain-containing protein [Verrucomicrobia bacterium]|nr:DUF1624 domain-containing protein [Verrucomicrobiota bacterium]MBI3867441.1 DUF1624 domain-containing protein [Verrucomicrobiota bacterium]
MKSGTPRSSSPAERSESPNEEKHQPPERNTALDMARGLAVLGMIYVHLVPTEGTTTLAQKACAGVARFLEDKTAVLFCVLVGMAQALQLRQARGEAPSARSVARRSLTLAAAGFALHWLVWPTEILVPLALMMVATGMILRIRMGRNAPAFAAGLLLVFSPIAVAIFAPTSGADWTDADRHVGESAWGWATARFVFLNGNYPLLPWTAFPLCGAAMIARDWNRGGGARSWFFGGLAATVALQLTTLWTARHVRMLGALSPYLASRWTPTTLPFVFLTGATAVTLIAGLSWWEEISASGLPRLAKPLALFGRASLTHYLLHICLVIAPLRIRFPAEDWPLAIGLSAAVIYVAVAGSMTVLWFRRYPRGPFEMLWAIASARDANPSAPGRTARGMPNGANAASGNPHASGPGISPLAQPPIGTARADLRSEE